MRTIYVQYIWFCTELEPLVFTARSRVQPRKLDPERDTQRARMRGLPEDWRHLGALANLPDLRARWLLRQFEE